jgi:hypothetical protein
MVCDVWADILDVEHLLEDRVRIVEKFGMQAHLHKESFADIRDVAFLVRDDIFLVKLVILRLNLLHIVEAVVPLDEADEDYFLVDLREYFDKKLNLSEVAILGSAKQHPQGFDDSWLCCLKVSLD